MRYETDFGTVDCITNRYPCKKKKKKKKKLKKKLPKYKRKIIKNKQAKFEFMKVNVLLEYSF